MSNNNRSFNDFAATLSFYTPPGGSSAPDTAQSDGASGESKGLMGWASRGVQSIRSSADDIFMTRDKLMTFGALFAGGVFCMFVSFTFLPFLLIAPQKFATLFTFGSLMMLGSFSTLRGHAAFREHLFSSDKLPFTLGYSACLIGTLWSALLGKGYVLTLVFSVAQMIGLLYFLVSYFPGGVQALTFAGSAIVAAVKSCIFGRASTSSILPM